VRRKPLNWRGQGKKKTRDLGVVRCIKDDNGRVLSEDVEIKVRWKKYFSKLLNDEVIEDF